MQQALIKQKHSPMKPLTVGDMHFHSRMFLAPMAGVGDSAFRRVCAMSGAAAVVSEMVSAKALTYGNKKTIKMLVKDRIPIPQGLQLFGAQPRVLSEAVSLVRATGWSWIDLNAGCPVPKVTKTGAGAALLQDTGRLKEVLQAMREAHDGILSLKIRSGWFKHDPDLMERIGRLVDEVGVDMVTLHARTKKQGYSGKPDYEMIRILKQSTGAVVVGNGDVRCLNDAERLMAETGCDAVMIGRGALGRPWIFTGQQPVGKALELLIIHHFEMLFDALDHDENKACRVFRRHLASYAKGAVDAARLRFDAVRVESAQDVKDMAHRIAKAKQGEWVWQEA